MTILLHFFEERGYEGVPGEVLVEHYTKVPRRMALTHCILMEPDSNGSHVTTILTGATEQKLSFVSIYIQTVGVEPDVQRFQCLPHSSNELWEGVLSVERSWVS